MKATCSKYISNESEKQLSSDEVPQLNEVLLADSKWSGIKRNFRNVVFNITSDVPANVLADLQDSNELGFYLKIISKNIYEMMAWYSTNADEKKNFLDIIMCMRLDRKPSLKD